MKTERFLATVLFTDIVGSTERAAEVGDRHWHDLLRRHHAVVRAELRRCGGRELNTTGDGFLATFDRPERGIRCACAIRDRVRGLGLEIRGGLHAGEVELIENTVGGIAVHTAARVAAAAGPGEVLVSGALRDFVAGSGFTFEDRGARQLKGVPGEWRLYAVEGEPVRLEVASFWERAREARLPRVLLLYLGAAAAVLALTMFVQERFGLPAWTFPLGVLLLVIGLVIIGATAWVQAHAVPGAAGAGSREAPGSWELDLPGVGRSVARGKLPHLTWSRSILGGVVAFSLLFGLAGVYVLVKDRGRTFAPSEAVAEAAAPAVAVLPFSVRGEGLDVWREGMVDVLSTNLDGAGGFRAIDTRTVLARWRERVSGEAAPDLQTSLQVARSAGARFAVVGSALTTGPDVRFAATIYDVDAGETLGRAEAVGPPDSVLAIANQLSLEVLRSILQEPEAEVQWRDLASLTTASVPALKAYLRGEALYRRSDFEGAAAAYGEAVAADSTFALALYRLGDTYGWMQALGAELVGEFHGRAVRLIDRMPEREATLLRGLRAFEAGSLDAFTLMEQAVRRYPDDPEAWFLLGDIHYHLGHVALKDLREGESAIGRAVELDPDFSPYYLHLLDYAVLRGDSARAAELLETFAALAPGTPFLATHRLALALSFGDSASRRAAVAALDTVSITTLQRIDPPLAGPRTVSEFAAVVAERRSRPGAVVVDAALVTLAELGRGRLEAAIRSLDDPLLSPAARAVRAFELYQVAGSGTAADVEQVFARATTDTTAEVQAFYEGLWAAERERWHDHGESLRRLENATRRRLAEGDTTRARVVTGMTRGVEGWRAWKEGEREAALETLQAAQRQTTGYINVTVNRTLRRGIGELLLEMSRPLEAVPYFRSLVSGFDPAGTVDPRAAFRLGEIYEELNQPTEAREAYEYVVLAWMHADPALQPIVTEARAAVQRLSSAIRE